jgi:hypothetical protein
MRIDPMLCHKILVAVESDSEAGSGQFLQISISEYDADVIAKHVKYLWEMEMLTGVDVTHMQSPCTPEIAVTDITPAGRSFLDENELEPPRRKIGF